MKLRRIVVLVWILLNILLVAKYFIDSYGIRCEPCMEDFPCPPCETDYMKNIFKYIIGWNMFLGVAYLLARKKRI